jgi:hypothetical protein
MNKYQIYSLLGKILALDATPSHRELIIPDLQREDIIWERFVALADHHLILQSLYPKIRDHELSEYFPREVFEHLKYIFELTTARNLEVIGQAEKLTAALRKESITPLFMKGVGNILDGLYKYPGERILHDIDILVPEKNFEDAAGILIKDGYRSDYKYNPALINRTRHYPILYKPGEPVYAELHRMPVGERFERFFNTGIVLGSAKHPAAYPDCLVMSDEHNIIHNFIHAQLDHQARIYAREFIRNLYDLLLLSGRTDPEVVLADFGHFRRASSGYLDIAYDTFDIIPAKRKLPGFFLHFYRFRYKLNMRSRFVGVASLFFTRVFLGYFVNPIMAITDRELRIKLMNKLVDPEWYKRQGRYYRRVLGIRKNN